MSSPTKKSSDPISVTDLNNLSNKLRKVEEEKKLVCQKKISAKLFCWPTTNFGQKTNFTQIFFDLCFFAEIFVLPGGETSGETGETGRDWWQDWW